MKIYKIEPLGFASNSYILTADYKTAVIIDCAQPQVLQKCQELKLIPKYVLLTHGHYDHIGGCGKAFDLGAEIICAKDEKDLIFSDGNRAIFHGIQIPYFEIGKTLVGGEKLDLCGIEIECIATPGHTEGGMSYLIDG